MKDNAWHWWQQALEAPKDIGKSLPVSDGHPEQGFYRVRKKNSAWEPVAIWIDDDNWLALRSGKPVKADEIWTWACRNPITAEAYDRALAGGGWADDDPTVASMIGHNVGDNDIAALRDQIESAKQGADAYLDITTEDEAAKAQSLRARMNELAGVADKTREALKRPHLEAGKAIDAEWMPLVKEAKAIADSLRKNIEVFKTAQLMELRRLELERQKLDVAVTPPELPTIDATIKGSYGRAATVKTRQVVTGISDLGKLLQWYAGDTRLQAFLLELAQKDTDQGIATVPGVTVEEKAVIS
jgi:hypothetical protein